MSDALANFLMQNFGLQFWLRLGTQPAQRTERPIDDGHRFTKEDRIPRTRFRWRLTRPGWFDRAVRDEMIFSRRGGRRRRIHSAAVAWARPRPWKWAPSGGQAANLWNL
jgi:hypothetical protein